MKALVKSMLVVGRVFGLVMGANFAMPVDVTLEQYQYIRFDY